MEINISDLKQISAKITFTDRLDHILARLSFKRMKHMVNPGLYKIG